MKTKPKTQPVTCFAPLVVLPTTTDFETLAMVKAAGYVCVLCDDPAKVKVILPSSEVVGSDLLNGRPPTHDTKRRIHEGREGKGGEAAGLPIGHA